MLTVGSLFAGIGGFDLGLERAGMRVRWQVEIDPYCQRVLAKHWPDVTRYGDIRAVDWSTVEPVDLLCGGFPCQDISLAGKGAGLTGERSGLWFEYAKAIAALRPRYVLIENVSALRSRGLDQVLGALASFGYDAEWHCIPACAVGAPHRRDRVWVVAYTQGTGTWGNDCRIRPRTCGTGGRQATAVANTPCERCRETRKFCQRSEERATGSSEVLADPQGIHAQGFLHRSGEREPGRSSWWAVEPELGRVAHGVPHRVDRLRGLGNAIVPQIAEWLGRQIIIAQEDSYDRSRTREAGTVLS